MGIIISLKNPMQKKLPIRESNDFAHEKIRALHSHLIKREIFVVDPLTFL